MSADLKMRNRWKPAATLLACWLACSLAPAVAVAQETDGADAPTAKGFVEIIFSGGVLGISIIVVLLALSVVAAYLIIDHLLSVRRADVMPDGLGPQVKTLLANRQFAEAREVCNQNPSVLSFVLLHGISEIEYGWTAVEKAIEDALAEQSARLYRKIEYLSVIGNIAPMVGLLGTVTGMIMAFQQVAATQATAGAPQLAEGIYQALVTTVGGLIVAIPSIGAFAIFRNRIDQLIAETGYTAQHVFGPLRRKKKPAS
ncbi:MAG: MotA/TolQ/ExbB proton channel family protein [Pirellulaceae bacterium]